MRGEINKIHFLLLLLNIYGISSFSVQAFGNFGFSFSILWGGVFALIFLAVVMICIVFNETILRDKNLYMKSAVAAGFSSVVIFFCFWLFPSLAGEQFRSSKFFFYGMALDFFILTATFLLFYANNYVPSDTIESIKIEITVNLQMLYLFVLGNITGGLGLYSQVLTGTIPTWEELSMIFLTAVGVLAFVIIPQGKIISTCIGKLRRIEKNAQQKSN